jgi:formate dehydrogenase iron-sulfur subunit
MAEKGMLFDTDKCIACRSCQVACKQWNELPAEQTTFFAAKGGYQNPIALSPKTYNLVKFYEVEKEGKLRWLFRSHRCLHCVDPACVTACPVEPVKAMTHDKELGIVYVNKELCIGCGACNEYCPWSIPQIDDKTEKSTKCTFCIDRVTNGLEPACAKACPTGAIKYGDYGKILKMAHEAKKTLEEKGRHPQIYGEKELGTGTRKIYVLPEPIDFYPDLPRDPKVSEDLGFFRELLKPFGGLALTASVIGLLIGRVKEVREKQKV